MTILSNRPNLVILFSGGADSTLLLKMAKSMGRKPIALTIDYEQLHRDELTFAFNFAKENDIEQIQVSLNNYDVNSGLTGDGVNGAYKNVHAFNVPARNSIFLSIAAGICESRGINEIWFGANWADYENKFPDCYQEYIGRMNKVFEISGVNPIKIYAPLLGCSKEIINGLMDYFHIDKTKVFSGYGDLDKKESC